MRGNDTRHCCGVLVIGLGNVLRSDDGVGVHLARALARESWPPPVRILDAGTPGLALLDLIEGAGQVVILDACQLHARPGTLRIFTPEEVRSRTEGAPLSIHEADVLGALRLGEAVGLNVSVTLVGIQPTSLEPGTKLSPALTELFPEILDQARRLLQSLVGGGRASPEAGEPS